MSCTQSFLLFNIVFHFFQYHLKKRALFISVLHFSMKSVIFLHYSPIHSCFKTKFNLVLIQATVSYIYIILHIILYFLRIISLVRACVWCPRKFSHMDDVVTDFFSIHPRRSITKFLFIIIMPSMC